MGQLRALMRVRHRVAAACERTNSAHLCECAIVSRCSGLRAGQLRALTRMCHLTAFRRLACGPTPRSYADAPSYRVAAACVRANSAHSREYPIVSRCSGLRASQSRVLTRMRHLTAFRRHACVPTPRTYASAPSYRVVADCIQINSAHLHECAIALQRHTRAPTGYALA